MDDDLFKRYGLKSPNQPAVPRKDGDDTVASVLDDEFTALGYPSTARLSILGDVGRENNWNRNTIFGGHNDPKNNARNRGIISWQGSRRTNLDNHLKQEGVYGKGDDDELRGMARFMDKELREQYPKVHKRLNNAQSTYDASEALRHYIRYDPNSPYNTPDKEFRVKNNADWAKKAQALGLAQDIDFDGLADRYGLNDEQPMVAPDNDLFDRYGLGDKSPTQPSPTFPSQSPSIIDKPIFEGDAPMAQDMLPAYVPPEVQKQTADAIAPIAEAVDTPAGRVLANTTIDAAAKEAEALRQANLANPVITPEAAAKFGLKQTQQMRQGVVNPSMPAPPRQYTRRSIDPTKGGYYPFEETGKADDLEYLGISGNVHYFKDTDADEYKLDETTKKITPLNPYPKRLKFGEDAYIRKSDGIYTDPKGEDYNVAKTDDGFSRGKPVIDKRTLEEKESDTAFEKWLAGRSASQELADQYNAENRTAFEKNQADAEKEWLAKNPDYAKWMAADPKRTTSKEDIEIFNAENKASFEKQQVQAEKDYLAKNATYADFLKQTGLPNNQASIDEFNLANKASVTGTNTPNQVDAQSSEQVQIPQVTGGEPTPLKPPSYSLAKNIGEWMNTGAGEQKVDLTGVKGDKNQYALRKYLEKNAALYGFTPSQINAYVAKKKGKEFQEGRIAQDRTGEVPIELDKNAISDVLTGSSGKIHPYFEDEFTTQKAQQRPLVDTGVPTGMPEKDARGVVQQIRGLSQEEARSENDPLYREAKYNIKKEGGTEKDVEAEYLRLQSNEKLKEKEIIEEGKRKGYNWTEPQSGGWGAVGMPVKSGLVGGTGQFFGAASGFLHLINQLPRKTFFGDENGQSVTDVLEKWTHNLSLEMQTASATEAEINNDTWSSVQRMGGEAIPMLGRFAVLSRLPGGKNTIVLFGTDAGLQSVDRNKAVNGEVFKDTAKGAGFGLLLHGASKWVQPKIQKAIANKLGLSDKVMSAIEQGALDRPLAGTEAGVLNAARRAFVAKIGGEAARFGTIAGGTYTMAVAEGSKHPGHDAAMLMLFDTVMNAKRFGNIAKLSKHAFRIAPEKPNEKPRDMLLLTEGGDKLAVYDVTGKFPDEAITGVIGRGADRSAFESKYELSGRNAIALSNKSTSAESIPKPKTFQTGQQAIWENAQNDQPVNVIGKAGELNGETYYNIEGSKTAIPESELKFTTLKPLVEEKGEVIPKPDASLPDTAKDKIPQPSESLTSKLPEIAPKAEKAVERVSGERVEGLGLEPPKSVKKLLEDVVGAGKGVVEPDAAIDNKPDQWAEFQRDADAVKLANDFLEGKNVDPEKLVAISKKYNVPPQAVKRQIARLKTELETRQTATSPAKEEAGEVAGEKEPWGIDTFKKPMAERGNRFRMSDSKTGMIFDREYNQSITPPKFSRKEAEVLLKQLNESDFNHTDSRADVLKVVNNKYVIPQTRREAVEEALKLGKTVSPEVLAEHQDWQQKRGKAVPTVNDKPVTILAQKKGRARVKYADGTKETVSETEVKSEALSSKRQSFEAKHGTTPEKITAAFATNENVTRGNANIMFSIAYKEAGGKSELSTREEIAELQKDFVESYHGKKLKYPLEDVEGELNLESVPLKPYKAEKIASIKPITTQESTKFSLVQIQGKDGLLIATDGHRLILIKDKSQGKTEKRYNRDTGKTEKPQGQFPNWQMVVPEDHPQSDFMDIQPLIDFAARTREVDRNIRNPRYGKTTAVALDFGEFQPYINSQYFYEGLRALQANGATKVKVHAKDANASIMFEDNAGNRYVVMPVYEAATYALYPDKITVKGVAKTAAEQDEPLRQVADEVEGFDSAKFIKERDAIPLVKNDKGELLAPNGKKSNLPEKLWQTVRTKPFLEYGGENWSKLIRDENDEPKILYHGTEHDVSIFNNKPQGALPGIFFTDSPQDAEGFATGWLKGYENENANIMPVFLRMEKPAKFTENKLFNFDKTFDQIQLAKKTRHDGVIIEGVRNVPKSDVYRVQSNPKSVTYIAFDSTQIKSIFNRGSYLRDDSNILRQAATAKAKTLLATLESAHIQDVIDSIEVKIQTAPDGSKEIELNEHAGEFTRRLISAAGLGETPFYGTLISNSTLKTLAIDAQKAARKLFKLGYTAKQTQGMIQLANAFNTMVDEHVVVYIFDESLPEERRHKLDKTAGGPDAEGMAAVVTSPIFQNPGAVFNREYGNTSDKTKAYEIVAKIATGQAGKYGWNDPVANAKILRDWANGILDQAEAKGITLDPIKFKEIYDDAKNEKSDERGDTARQGTRSPVESDTETGEATGDKVKRGSDAKADEAGAAVSEGSELGKSRVGQSIEAKTIEKDLTQNFGETADYDKITIKDQAEKMAKMLTDPERVQRIIRGEEKLPDEIRGGSFITAVENDAMARGDVETLKALANSHLTAETSRHAQELRTLAERDPDSVVVQLREIKKAREEAAQKRLGKKSTVKEALKKEVNKIKTEIQKRAPKKQDWNAFLRSIACK